MQITCLCLCSHTEMSSCQLKAATAATKLNMRVCPVCVPLQASPCKVLEGSSVLQLYVYLLALLVFVVMIATLVLEPNCAVTQKKAFSP
jgi:hypothetical protein